MQICFTFVYAVILCGRLLAFMKFSSSPCRLCTLDIIFWKDVAFLCNRKASSPFIAAGLTMNDMNVCPATMCTLDSRLLKLCSAAFGWLLSHNAMPCLTYSQSWRSAVVSADDAIQPLLLLLMLLLRALNNVLSVCARDLTPCVLSPGTNETMLSEKMQKHSLERRIIKVSPSSSSFDGDAWCGALVCKRWVSSTF